MKRTARLACLALALALVGGFLAADTASAQVVRVYYPPVAVPAPVVTYYPAPSTVTYSYYPPATTVYSAPAPVYAVPTTVYSAPYTVYSGAPVAYAAPAVVYPSTVATTGIATTRSYLGFGIFRPFGVNRVTTYTPTGVAYYPPVYVP